MSRHNNPMCEYRETMPSIKLARVSSTEAPLRHRKSDYDPSGYDYYCAYYCRELHRTENSGELNEQRPAWT